MLKHFPAATPRTHATWVHGLMCHLRAAGITTVPDVVTVQPGGGEWGEGSCATLIADSEGLLWELVEFVPGSTRPAPTAAEAADALEGLARLHAAAATLPGDTPRLAPSPGIARRVEQAGRMIAAPWASLESVAASRPIDPTHGRLERACHVFAASRGTGSLRTVAACGVVPVVAQPVLRDIWSAHVLFADAGRLAGFVDFQAAGSDSPATDLARLLGSWQPQPTHRGRAWIDHWIAALAAYEAVRPLSPQERSLIPWLQATGVICGLDNWFRWLITDRRAFDDMNRVLERIDRFIQLLPESLETAREPIPGRN